MSKTVAHTFTINASGSPAVDQFSAAMELPPDISPDAVSSAQYLLENLVGGTAPTVTPELQVSNDNVNWVDLHPLWGASAPALTANGSSFLIPAAGAGMPDFDGLSSVRYLRMKGTPGGTAVPTSWDLSVIFRIKTN